MNILIIGAGTVGFNLAEQLAGLKHQVTIIEPNEDLCDEISGKLDVYTISGIGSDPLVLEKSNISKMDIVIAVTPSDEINLLVCNFAMQSGVPKRIARVKSEVYTVENPYIDLKKLGVTTVIEPEKEVVEKILQYVELPKVIEAANFKSNDILLRGYRVTNDMPIANKTLIEVKDMAKSSPMLIVLIVRDGMSLHPHGSQRLLPGDKIIVIMPRKSFKAFCHLINQKITKLKKIIVFGETLTAIHLVEALKSLADRVLLVDPDLKHSQFAASILDKIEVIHGDCTNSDILQEINVEHADCFIAASNDTEDNIMSCLLAKNSGTDATIALRNDDKYMELFNTLGIDYIVNPNDITSNMIIEKIQIVPIGSYLKLKTADVEIQRLKAEDTCPLVGKPLSQLGKFFKESIILCAIIRDDQVIIPWGETIIRTKDEAIILCEKKQLDLVKKWFLPSLSARIRSKTKKLPI